MSNSKFPIYESEKVQPVQFPKGLIKRNSFQSRASIVKKYSAVLSGEKRQQKEEVKFLDNLRFDIKKTLTTTNFGIFYTNGISILSALSALHFIYMTYVDPNDAKDTEDNLQLELGLAAIFGFDWALRLFVADHVVAYVTG
jgi:hypothetical protein